MFWKNLSRFKGIFFVIGALFILYGMTLNASAASSSANINQTDASDTTVTVKWSKDKNAYGYNVYLSSNGKNYSRTTDDSECDVHKDSGVKKKITGLKAGQRYFVMVYPVYKNSDGTVTEGNSLGRIKVVTSPSRVKASSIKQTKATAKSITIKWASVKGATGYIIYLDGKKVKKVKKTTTKIKVSAGSINNVQIRPIKKCSTGFVAKGGYTEAYDLYAAPGKPVKLASFSNNNFEWTPVKSNSVTVGWEKATSDEYEATGYQVEIYTLKGSKLATYYTKSTSKVFNIAFVKNKGFKVRVRGYIKVKGKKCYGKWSDMKVVIPQASITLKREDKTTLNVSWSAVANVQSYVVYVCYDASASTKNWVQAAVVSKDTYSYTIKNCIVGNSTAVYVVPVVKIGSKTYKASFTWYLFMEMK